jgi:hypothetical protein
MEAQAISSLPGRMGRRRSALDARRIAPTAVAAALAAVYLLWQPPSLDLAAAEYRAWLFGHAGFAVWDAQWYGGHHLPGYSVVFPPLAHWLGPRVVGALAVVAAAALFERIAHSRCGERAWVGATWFAAGAATTLFSGRLTFALGLVPALGAIWALQKSTTWTDRVDRSPGSADPDPTGPARRSAKPVYAGLAAALAVLTPLASPVAALFLALAGTAYAVGERRASGLLVAGAALAPVAALAVVFPEGGIEPFALSSFWPVLAVAAIALVLVPREERTLRISVVLYALGCTAAFLLDTPVGGNVVRLGALCAGPLAALVLWPRRRTALLLLAPFLLWWQWTAAVNDVRTASGDPSVHAAYYAPLLAALDRAGAQGGTAGRLEIPFTRLHWEARHVAPHVPLARGWERQLDLKVNPLFYGDQTGAPPLTAARYRDWLDRMAVRWVAVPDLRLDYSAQDEARLVARGLPYLRLVWRGAHWRLYEVRDPAPLADPPARVLQAGTDSLTLAVPRPGTIGLRVHWTPYWAIARGDACVEPAGDWTRLRVRSAGTIRLTTDFALGRIGSRAARCGDRIVVNSG